MITGTVTYRVRMALPANAAIDVRLEDVSRADAPAAIVAENIFAAGGKQVPIPFQLTYSPGDIQAGHRYQVRAQIIVEDKSLFVTSSAYPVLTNGAPSGQHGFAAREQCAISIDFRSRRQCRKC
jgi:putative lipoprotein